MKAILWNATVCGCLTLATVAGCTKSESSVPATAVTAELMMVQAAASLARTSDKPDRIAPDEATAESISRIDILAEKAMADLIEVAPESETETPKQSPRAGTARVPTPQEVKWLLEELNRYRAPNSSSNDQSLADGQK